MTEWLNEIFTVQKKNIPSLFLMATHGCPRCEVSLLQFPSGQGRVWYFVLSQGDPVSVDGFLNLASVPQCTQHEILLA